MVLKRSDDYSELRLNGFLAWIHRLVMIITFPIRRFWQIVSILAAVVVLMVIANTYYGIGFEHVSKWYNSVVPNAALLQKKDQTIAALTEKLEQIKNSTMEAVVVQTEPKEEETAEQPPRHFTAWNVPEFERATITPTAESFQVVSVETKPAPVPAEEKKQVKKEKSEPKHIVEPKSELKMEPKYEPKIKTEIKPKVEPIIEPEPEIIVKVEPEIVVKVEPEEVKEEYIEEISPQEEYEIEDEPEEEVAQIEDTEDYEFEEEPEEEDYEFEPEPQKDVAAAESKAKIDFPSITKEKDKDDDGFGYRLSFASEEDEDDSMFEEPKAPPAPSIQFFGAMPKARSDNFGGGKLTDYYKIIKNRGLIYLSDPEIVYGSAEIVGPNSLFVNDKFMFLYGIYTDPSEYDAVKAQKYLESLTSDSGVRCAIVAYAGQTNSATALCFTPKTFINGALVKQDLARNISLK